MIKNDIEKRTRNYAIQAIKLAKSIEKDDINRILIRQYVRSATSLGANVAEAQAASSRKDFVNKMQIASKEARETKYWLSIMRDIEVCTKAKIAENIQEAGQIINIITAIVKNTQKNEAYF